MEELTQTRHMFDRVGVNYPRVKIDALKVRTSIHPKKIVLSSCKLKQKHIKGYDFYDKGYWLSGLNKAKFIPNEQKISYVIINGQVYKLNTYTHMLRQQKTTYKVLENTLIINTPCNNTPYTLVEIYKTTKSNVEKIASKLDVE